MGILLTVRSTADVDAPPRHERSRKQPGYRFMDEIEQERDEFV